MDAADSRARKTLEHRTKRERKSLREFDRLSRQLEGFVTERYGAKGAESLLSDARAHYLEVISQVSWVSGPRAPIMNTFLGMTALALSVYKAIEARGGTAPEAWEICHEASRLKVAQVPNWKRWLLRRLMFSKLMRRVARRREGNDELVRAGDFEIRFVAGDGTDFDLGVDYLRCGNLELARKVGAEGFAPYVCMSDIALSDALGWGLIRTQTLADGCSHCDFRFKDGGATQISSRTPQVQETIERIARSESVGTAAAQPGV